LPYFVASLARLSLLLLRGGRSPLSLVPRSVGLPLRQRALVLPVAPTGVRERPRKEPREALRSAAVRGAPASRSLVRPWRGAGDGEAVTRVTRVRLKVRARRVVDEATEAVSDMVMME
jgi:hypothetical protein